MDESHELHVLRVFCKENGHAGNLLGVFPGSPAVPVAARQAVASDLGFPETVFVDDLAQGRIAIFTPTTQLSFAGHPLVGTAWLLRQANRSLAVLRPNAGEIHVREQGNLTWVRARPEYSPPWTRRELLDPFEVGRLRGPPDGLGHVQAWAWADEQRGVVRARVFASDYGVAEDAATGSAAIALCSELNRELRIIQGPDGAESEIYVKPAGTGHTDLGGRVLVDRPPAPYQTKGL
jgi:predicted PhzF superfamily epimerase YddE/YHI9